MGIFILVIRVIKSEDGIIGTCSLVVETRIHAKVWYGYPTDGVVSRSSLEER
jgi:hypothetical protein